MDRFCIRPNIGRVGRAAAAALLALLPALAGAAPYQLVDLGSLGGVKGSGAYALNGSGVVAGYSFVAGSSFVHAMINNQGSILDLGTLGGTQSLARAVNSNGWVVGWAYPQGLSWQRAFLWHDGTMTELGTLGGISSDASDINDSGLIVGASSNPDGNSIAFWWRDGVMHPMGTFGGSLSQAFAVNEAGDISGMAETEGDDEIHAFLAKAGSPLYDLGTLGGPASRGIDINEHVHVCGWSMIQANNPASRGFLWADGVMKSLGTLGGIYSSAFSLNDHDQVVGESTRGDEVQVAFLWSNDQMVDLNTLIDPSALIPSDAGLLITSAYDIDALGRIVGVGTLPNHETRAVMLVPSGTADAPPVRPTTRFAGAIPNPARGASRFDFTLAHAGRASLTLLDVSGRAVRSLVDADLPAGPQSIHWDGLDEAGSRVAPGVYHARLVTEQGAMTRRFAVVR